MFSVINGELRNQATAYLDASFLYSGSNDRNDDDDNSNFIVRLPDGRLHYKFCAE